MPLTHTNTFLTFMPSIFRRHESLPHWRETKCYSPSHSLQVAKSFGFTVPPKVNLNVSAKGTRVKRKGFGAGWAKGKEKPKSGGNRHFSAQNPYGKRDAGDKRQFVKF